MNHNQENDQKNRPHDFVIAIDHIEVKDNQKYPNIVIWTKINQEDTYRPFRKFEYEVVKGKLEAR